MACPLIFTIIQYISLDRSNAQWVILSLLLMYAEVSLDVSVCIQLSIRLLTHLVRSCKIRLIICVNVLRLLENWHMLISSSVLMSHLLRIHLLSLTQKLKWVALKLRWLRILSSKVVRCWVREVLHLLLRWDIISTLYPFRRRRHHNSNCLTIIKSFTIKMIAVTCLSELTIMRLWCSLKDWWFTALTVRSLLVIS